MASDEREVTVEMIERLLRSGWCLRWRYYGLGPEGEFWFHHADKDTVECSTLAAATRAAMEAMGDS